MQRFERCTILPNGAPGITYNIDLINRDQIIHFILDIRIILVFIHIKQHMRVF